MENNKLKELAKMFFENYEQPTEEDLYNFLVDNEAIIAGRYENLCHREDILYELEEREYLIDKIPDDFIDNMLDYFEDKLGDFGSEVGWRPILDDVIEYYYEDLKEYALEDEEDE